MPKFEQIPSLTRFCRQLAQQGGAFIREHQGELEVRSKGRRDWVTAVDEAVQDELERAIHSVFPKSLLLGEESSAGRGLLGSIGPDQFSLPEFAESLGSYPEKSGDLIWIIDPIDGTNNFIHGFPFYAVSVAAAIGNTVVAGAVLDVCRQQCFWTGLDSPAFCNDAPIQVSDCRELSQAMVVGSIPRLYEKYPQSHEIFQQVSQRSRAVRRLGSAALNLAYIAAGQLDAYWALSLQIWDVAAGALLLNQAGGVQSIVKNEGTEGLAYLGSASTDLQSQMSSIVDS